MIIRFAQPADRPTLAAMRHSLWPEATAAEHARELEALDRGEGVGILPLLTMVAQDDHGTLIGFVEVGLRSVAEGCDRARPVGYIEGWYVVPERRREKIGAKLVAAAEEWARTQGCSEMASDVAPDNITSQRAHEALGFEETERSVCYRKSLARGS